MTEQEIKTEYFNWLCDFAKIGNPYIKGNSYNSLFGFLFCKPFTVLVSLDSNRATDGLDLRERFASENYIPSEQILEAITDPCSILEMMMALSLRCEEHIMTDEDKGNRTYLWFWSMITNLGLHNMTDQLFDEGYVNYVCNRLNRREYCFDGTGGLFTIRNASFDIRKVEIWYQMNMYLRELDET